jgi:hypothetical protein
MAPSGPASIKPVVAACEARRIVAIFVTSEAGRARPEIVGIPGAFREPLQLFAMALAHCDEFDEPLMLPFI